LLHLFGFLYPKKAKIIKNIMPILLKILKYRVNIVSILNNNKAIMTKVKAIADKFFGGNVENFLTEMAGTGFKVDGWSDTTELPLDAEGFRSKVFVVLTKSGVTEKAFRAALSSWSVQSATENINDEPINSVQPGAIEKIEDTVIDAIAVQNAGIQQLSEIQLDQQISEARTSGVTEGIVLELAKLDGKFETQVQIRDILTNVNKTMHEDQKTKALSLAGGLLTKIQGSYSRSSEASRASKVNQEATEGLVASIFERLAGLNNSAPQSAEGK
jgi:hypothetical protein